MRNAETMSRDVYRRLDEANGAIRYLDNGQQECVACGQRSRVTKIGSDEPLRTGLLEMSHTHDCPHTAELQHRLGVVFPGYAAALRNPPNPLPRRRPWPLRQHPCVNGHDYVNRIQYTIGATRGYRQECRHCGVAAVPCEQRDDAPFVDEYRSDNPWGH